MSILRIVGSTWANLWAVYKNSSLKPVFRQILWKFLWFCPVIFCSEIFRAEWIIQFYMLFHILFFRWKQSIPTTFHILASYIEKTTTNWRYFPQITKALNYVTFNCAPPEGLALGKDGNRIFSDMNIFILPTMLWSSSTSAELLSS